MKKLILLFLLAGFSTPLFAQKSDSIHVFFATGKSILTPGIQEQITNYVYRDVLRPGQAVMIVGYADYVGGNKYNETLSQNRAKAVKKYLMQSGFGEKDITICIGKGKVDREQKTPGGYIHDRRVDIVTNPEVPAEETAQAPPPPPPTPAADQPAVPGKALKKDIAELKKNETLVLQNIYFYAGRHVVKPESEEALNDLYQILASHPTVKVQIEGHVCCVNGTISDALDFDTKEIKLSLNRAKMINDYLVKKGIAKDRLSYKGFGATHRIAEETNEDEADKNRRVEIRIQ